MYIGVKQRQNKHSEQVFYLYLCQSKRVEGKVTNKQKYLLSVREKDLLNGTFKEKFNTKLSSVEYEVKQRVEKKVTIIMQSL